ncbi:MAG: hypothetical protein H7232_16910 [Aeromicrobium sp.]|nr:hypothetical protein [Burkholderiales bacterium]
MTATTQIVAIGGAAAVTVTGSVAYTATAAPTITPTLTLALTDATTNVATTTVTSGKPAKVSATFKLASGAPVVGAVVTFATDANIGTFSPDNAAAVTDAAGVATVTLYPSKSSGAASVTGTTQTVVTGGAAAVTVTGSVAYTATAAPAITVALFDPTTGAARTTVTAGSPARVTATLRTTTGAPAVGAVVSFSTNAALGTFTPASGTALTDVNGAASVLLNATVTGSGVGVVTASGQIGTGSATTAVSATVGYALGTASVAITPVSIPAGTLSAFGTSAVSVTISVGGAPTNTPFTVNFTSPCATSGRAALTPSVVTIGGIATASYRDIGCAGADIITASVSGLAISSTGTISVAAPAVGSIQYVSATPTSITLRGTGGTGRQETSQVSFRVVDVGGNPLGGRTVSFTLNTTVGGIALSSVTATSDPSTGLVVTNVQAGTVSTPVRVTASTVAGNQTLTTQSDQLVITTGIPAQDSFSIAASTLNIEGWNIDGTTTQITVRTADHFRNPVPDGTAITFTAEGGSIVGSCTTRDGACSATFTSQTLRPSNGRITVLAYAVGEEGFTDLNGNGWFDLGELVDADGKSTDRGEAFVDFNENGIRDANEPFIDFNNNGIFDGPDGKYSGVLCDETVVGRSSPGSCSPRKTMHARGSLVVVLSSSTPLFFDTSGASVSAPFNLPSCDLTRPKSLSRELLIVDVNGNAMPAGTTISFLTTNGNITSPTSYTVGNTAACVTLDPASGKCPPSADASGTSFARYFVQVEADWTIAAGVCTNTRNSGILSVVVKAPSGTTTTLLIPVND